MPLGLEQTQDLPVAIESTLKKKGWKLYIYIYIQRELHRGQNKAKITAYNSWDVQCAHMQINRYFILFQMVK